jgi:isopentenyldiphosphate isomerase
VSSNTFAQQNDPHELLEVFDRAGRGTGLAKTRSAIHLDGDWHQAFHCWIVRPGGLEVVLQRRAARKDTFANCWDAAAAGHWRFGETPEEAAREIGEELGLDVPFAALRYQGSERMARRFPTGLTDREHHRVYVLESAVPLVEFRPDPREVSGVAAFRVPELLGLLGGRVSRVVATEAVSVSLSGQVAVMEVVVTRDEVVPYSVARMRRILRPVGRA